MSKYHRAISIINGDDDVEWAYHGTDPWKLPSIASEGLVPQEQPEEHADEARGVEEAVVFFSPTERYAGAWGGEIVRFPWPEESWEDPYGDTMWTNEGLVYTNHATPQYIPPDAIQAKGEGGWVPIAEAVGHSAGPAQTSRVSE